MGNNSSKVYESGTIESPSSDAKSTWELEFDPSRIVNDPASHYSACLVFPVGPQGELTSVTKHCLYVLALNKLEIFAYYGTSKQNIFVLVAASLEELKSFADEIDFAMHLDSEVLEEMARLGNPERDIGPIEIAHVIAESHYYPYDFIYGKFSLRMPEELYFVLPGENSAFHCTIKAKLVNQMVLRQPPSAANKLQISNYLSKGHLKAYFALHSVPQLLSLKRDWLRYPIIPWRQPFDQITRYFGEKISMYYIFLSHYSLWCAGASVIGVPLQLAVFALDNYSAPFLPIFAFFIALWGILMLEFWKRSESEWAMKWGTLGCEDTEADRSDYEGIPIKSYIDGKEMMYFSTSQRRRYMKQSMLGVLILILLVIGAVTSIYIIRFSLQQYIGVYAQTMASIINSVQIQVANAVYNSLAQYLNERENHRTETKHEDALIAKVFLFEFVNNYASFFYLAFVAEMFGDCPIEVNTGCMQPLTINLAIILASRTVVGNGISVLLPFLAVRARQHDLAHKIHQEKNYKEHTTDGQQPQHQQEGEQNIEAEVHKEAEEMELGFPRSRKHKPNGKSNNHNNNNNNSNSDINGEFTDKDTSVTGPSRPEQELTLERYDVRSSSIADFTALAIQFGYASMFAAALPMAPLMSLVCMVASNTCSAWKLLHLHQRPFPMSSEDIGTWQSIFTIVSIVSVITNAALTAFTMSTLDSFATGTRFWLFVGFQWTCFFIQIIIMESIPDVSDAVMIQQQRQTFLVDKIIDQVPDDILEVGDEDRLQKKEYQVFDELNWDHVKPTSANAVAASRKSSNIDVHIARKSSKLESDSSNAKSLACKSEENINIRTVPSVDTIPMCASDEVFHEFQSNNSNNNRNNNDANDKSSSDNQQKTADTVLIHSDQQTTINNNLDNSTSEKNCHEASYALANSIEVNSSAKGNENINIDLGF